ncbi:STAS domain-containing protein [Chitinibacter bivalviorum]|uniref:Anti-sigma factor antagonist n=1 Tax=Chitinibacter bivalviorum TaxID=2739434 RepID=A0A7H9BHP9_9NEIS|nr:STAS domain-containing protein [Chitinibacter bivalviorum]QLG87796.1 STAS domain-containing protein [Chitinibacter bivalviorum]
MNLINQHEQDDLTIISFNVSNLDASNADAFRKQVRPALEKSKKVALDMSVLQFVDSSGLGALLSCLRFCNEQGGSFVLFGLQRPVTALFELMRMHRVFNLFDSIDEIVGATS